MRLIYALSVHKSIAVEFVQVEAFYSRIMQFVLYVPQSRVTPVPFIPSLRLHPCPRSQWLRLRPCLPVLSFPLPFSQTPSLSLSPLYRPDPAARPTVSPDAPQPPRPEVRGLVIHTISLQNTLLKNGARFIKVSLFHSSGAYFKRAPFSPVWPLHELQIVAQSTGQ